MAIEIRVVRPNRVLPPELESSELAILQPRPEDALRNGVILPQFTGAADLPLIMPERERSPRTLLLAWAARVFGVNAHTGISA